MKDIIVKPELIFEGKKWNFITKAIANKRWYELYNQFSEVFNRHIGELNKSWDSVHGDVDLTNDESMLAKYNAFIADGMNKFTEHIGDRMFGVVTDKEECGMNIVLKKAPDCVARLIFHIVDE